MTDTKHSATTRAIERIISGGLNMGWISDAEASDIRAAIAAAAPAGEPVAQAPVATSEGGVLRWMTGRKIMDCELYAAPVPAAAPQAALTPEQIEQIAVDYKLPVRLASATDAHWAYTDKVMAFAKAIEAASGPNAALVSALQKIIEMNRQQAQDQYGDANKAESWSCIVVAHAALAAAGIGEKP